MVGAEVYVLLFILLACDGSKVDDMAGTCDTENEDCDVGTCGGAGSQMLPGANCLNCHTAGSGAGEEGEVPSFSLAGTVFADASGTEGLEGATVHVTDAEGTLVTMMSNAAGNFYTTDPIVLPVTATVEIDGGVAEMTSYADAGGCNSCHTCEGVAGGKLVGP